MLLLLCVSIVFCTAASGQQNKAKYEFKAETTNLLDIIVHSLYSDREIFLRELISNAVDALEKLRYISLTDAKVLGEGDTPMEINISVDTQKKLIIIEDTGIGMNKEEMITNLGTIAESGTSRFRQTKKVGLSSQDDDSTKPTSASGLIGMFGVGFFSSYLVAEKVDFYSRRAHDKADNYSTPHVVKWSSDASSYYTVEDVDDLLEPEACPHRGSRVVLHLRENSEEFLDTALLKHIILKYSGFVGFPVNLEMVNKHREEYTPSADEEDDDIFDAPLVVEDGSTGEKKASTASESKIYDDVDTDSKKDSQSFQDAEKAVKKRYRYVESREWLDVTKEATSIWLRNPQTITKEEYIDFYLGTLYKPDPALNFDSSIASLAKEMAPPLTWIHFRGEGGEADFRALIFVPGFPSLNYYEKYHDERATLNLYINRVFVTNETGSILPQWMQFVKGIVDSDSIRINLSREFIQESKLLKKIGERIARAMVKKITDLYKQAKDSEKEYDNYISELIKEGVTDPTKEQIEKAPLKDVTFYKIHHWYKRSFFMGAIEDKKNKEEIMHLLLFPTTRTMVNSPEIQEKFRLHQVSHEELPYFYTLQEYVDAMPAYQKDIYMISCTFIDECLTSPYTEAANTRGLEVIFLTDVNEDLLLTTYLNEFRANSGKVYKIKNIAKLETKLPDKPKDDASNEEEKEKERPDTDIPDRTEDKLLARYHLKLLRAYMRQATSTVHGVERSTKLPASTPALAASNKHSHTPLQEKAMQHSKNAGEADYHRKQRTLEVNFEHNLIKKFVAELVNLNPPMKPTNSTDSNDDYVIPKPVVSTPEMDERAVLLADIATYFAGYEIENKKSFAKALFMVLDTQLEGTSSQKNDNSTAFKDEL
ncbi:Grp94/Hsp90 [Giardia lamblia P15]|uniref:Grp94/Hsp90 n=1 Tax=Giardia intestinalis (strain P15) TaxID=658858 RepID=E1EWK5_GIAIA|nr:Grp94/Hsp90 [Giardia lamblia P15]